MFMSRRPRESQGVIHIPLEGHTGKEARKSKYRSSEQTRCVDQETAFPGDVLEETVDFQKQRRKDGRGR